MTAPLFTVVTAVYNVERYLPDYIESLCNQSGIAPELLQFVVVDDGSTDASLRLLEDWGSRDGRVTVLTKENGGQASARNAGLEHALGEWVTFLDPDDTVNRTYFSAISSYAERYPTMVVAASNVWLWMPNEPEPTDTHPLRFRFQKSSRPRNLLHETEYFVGSAPAAFFRMSTIRRARLRFDETVRPNFEDGHFCIRYLLECETPEVGFVKDAIYYYNKRDDGSSTLQNSLLDPRRYTVVPRAGYLDCLQRSTERYGQAPEFIQNYMLYELSYYFGAENSMSNRGTAATGEVGQEFLNVLAEIMGYISPAVVTSYRITELALIWRECLLHSLAHTNWHTDYCVVSESRKRQSLLGLVFRYVGSEPDVVYRIDGKEVEPVASKIRDRRYFGQTLIYERIAWIRADGALSVEVDGEDLRILPKWPSPVVRRYLPGGTPLLTPRKRSTNRWTRLKRRLVRRLARSFLVRKVFGRAWVVMDRLHDTGDSGLRLFEYLRSQRRDINAWFVLDRSASEWREMRRKYGQRLVREGSLRWLLLMLNCEFHISTHIDRSLYRPPRLKPYFAGKWPRFVFLQHGVIKDDLASWLGNKQIALFVTSTPAEHESIIGDHTRYPFTSVETKMTGLPRFDRLQRIADTVPVGEREWILVAPTWRDWLAMEASETTQRRQLTPDFFESEYYLRWRDFLLCPRLSEIASRHKARIGYLPHPNFQSALDSMDLPTSVVPLRYRDHDIQELIAKSLVVVTDYSSMVFNAAYVERPVVYYQFDSARFDEGGHTSKKGYFEYERDGFGPVAQDLEHAVDSIADILEAGAVVAPEYRARIEAAFPQRDGKCCERVTAEIEALNKRA